MVSIVIASSKRKNYTKQRQNYNTSRDPINPLRNRLKLFSLAKPVPREFVPALR